jgi:hypothetical protein
MRNILSAARGIVNQTNGDFLGRIQNFTVTKHTVKFHLFPPDLKNKQSTHTGNEHPGRVSVPPGGL